jgi:trimethylamine--corrinoid protein Co-methyltransferase
MNEHGMASGGLSLDRLDHEGCRAVHEASMRILEEFGVKLGHERARSLLTSHGASVDDDGVVTVPQDVVEDAVAAAPASFTLHARNPTNDVTVGGEGPPIRAPGYGPPNVLTYADGRRPATREDYETLLKLAQVEDVITCTGYRLCEPPAVEESRRHYEMLERALTLTDQPVMGATYGAERARACLDMVGIAVGDRDLSQPYVAGLVNTVPPRSIEREMLGGLLAYAERGQPPIVSSFTVAGASGPPTLAASLAQANAENLLAITLTQLVNPGTPVIYGAPTAAVDDEYGSLSIGTPESALFVAAAARLAAFYGLPSRAGGGLSDAKSVDHQSGFESMFVQTVTDFAGIDFVLNAAGILESYSTISPEKFVLDCEALGYLDRFREGFAVDEAHLDLDRIGDTDPAGHFVGEPGSAVGGEAGFFRSSFVDKRAHRAWAEDGEKSAFEQAHERVQRRLDAYERPALDADAERELARYVSAHGGH